MCAAAAAVPRPPRFAVDKTYAAPRARIVRTVFVVGSKYAAAACKATAAVASAREGGGGGTRICGKNAAAGAAVPRATGGEEGRDKPDSGCTRAYLLHHYANIFNIVFICKVTERNAEIKRIYYYYHTAGSVVRVLNVRVRAVRTHHVRISADGSMVPDVDKDRTRDNII